MDQGAVSVVLEELRKVQRPAVYVRVSSEDQVSGTSLDDQVDKCLKQAAIYGWEVAPERVFIDDGYSGSTLDRPAMARLRQVIAEGSVDCVIVYKLDRLSRNIRDTVNLVLEEWSKEYKVTFRSVTEDFNTNSPLGTLIFSILASFAHFERDVIRDRTENGRRRRFMQGRRATGEPPYGYLQGEVNGTMVIQPEQADVVRRIFRLYLRGLGFMRVAAALNESGVSTTRGRLWTEKTVRDILINEVYLGRVKYSGEYGAGQHAPVVDEETFTAAQEVRHQRDRVGGRSVGSEFLLAGIARCSGCSHLLYTQPATQSRRRRKDGSLTITQNHAYYQCGGRLKKGVGFCGCGYVQQELLEEHVVARIRERFGSLVTAAEAIRSLQEEMCHHITEYEADLGHMESTVREKWQAIERWESAFERGDLSADRFGARVLRLEQEIADLALRRVEALERLDVAKKRQVNIDWVRAVSQQVDTWAVLSTTVRKQLIHYLIEEVIVWRDSLGKGQHRNPPEVRVDIVWTRGEQALPAEEFDRSDPSTARRAQ